MPPHHTARTHLHGVDGVTTVDSCCVLVVPSVAPVEPGPRLCRKLPPAPPPLPPPPLRSSFPLPLVPLPLVSKLIMLVGASVDKEPSNRPMPPGALTADARCRAAAPLSLQQQCQRGQEQGKHCFVFCSEADKWHGVKVMSGGRQVNMRNKRVCCYLLPQEGHTTDGCITDL